MEENTASFRIVGRIDVRSQVGSIGAYFLDIFYGVLTGFLVKILLSRSSGVRQAASTPRLL